jgi:Fe-S cluster assembly ATPase SufC
MTMPDEGIDIQAIEDIKQRIDNLEKTSKTIQAVMHNISDEVDMINVALDTIYETIIRASGEKKIVPKSECEFVPGEPSDDE